MNFDEITTEALETEAQIDPGLPEESPEEILDATENANEPESIEEIEEVAADEESTDAEKAEAPAENESDVDANEIAYLKAELDSLKKELAESRAFYARLEGECTEFASLYPTVPLSSLPDSIWQSVKSGVPLAAAYALEARKAEIQAKRAETVNGENRNRSAGAFTSDSYNDFFTPSQVRSMSAAEVRANYTKIINSMSKWH